MLPAIVLAAGASSRCPEGKLSKLYKGRPLLTWTLGTLCEHPRISQVLVVCGHQMETLTALITPFEKTSVVFNARWKEGLASSLQAGLAELKDPARGVLVALGDTPFFRSQTLDKIIPNQDDSQDVRVPTYQGTPGHPKYFPSWTLAGLGNLHGDKGAQGLIRSYGERVTKIEVDDPGILRDFDRFEDFQCKP